MHSVDLTRALELAVRSAKAAGALLLADFRRPDGPRGHGDKAPADSEAETLLRDALEAAFPTHGIVGEELPSRDRLPQDGDPHTWWLDPNDGTRDYLEGARGSAVSIGLTRAGEPVLGVVFAFAAPDDDGDLIAWAEGQPLTRNGCPVQPTAWPTDLSADVLVAVSQHADRLSLANAELCTPARYCAVPSIAYRLALAAVGDADVALSLASPARLDCAAGHALLRATGGELFDLGGNTLRYTERWATHVIGGAPDLCGLLGQRAWGARLIGVPSVRGTAPFADLDLVRPKPNRHVHDAGLLSRAQGALLGQLAGDALGQLVEFKSAQAIAGLYPDGVRELKDGGTFDTLAGQPTDDSEMALALARSLARDGHYDPSAAARGYALWLQSRPYDLGTTTRTALSPALNALKAGKDPAAAAAAAASTTSQANGALMRISPLAIWGHSLELPTLARLAREDAALTHPNVVCQDANVVFTLAIAFAIRTGASPKEIYAFTLEQAQSFDVHADVRTSLEEAQSGPPPEFMSQMGWVRIALRNAFAQLLLAPSLVEGIVDTVGRGGDTDTNGCIAGALLGAAHGREAVPRTWRRHLAGCRAQHGLSGVRHPRPRTFWPVDALWLAEELAFAGLSARESDD